MSDDKNICKKCKTENPIDGRFCKKCGSSLMDETSEIDFGLYPQKIFVDRYKIISELGKGAMGVVYKSWDQKLERNIALKVIKFDQDVPTRISEIRKRMIVEAKAAAKLKHPNIVTIYDVGDEDLNTFIAMEYIEGNTLSDIIINDNLPDIDKILDIIIQICNAIIHAHERNIIHRDIKPSNIIFEENNVVKITDFGIAKILEETDKKISEKCAIVGTPSYMAPERFQGNQNDLRSDIFSIGIIIYELLTGEKPFKGSSVTEVMLNILNGEYEPIKKFKPTLPDFFENIISKSLAKDPENRYQFVNDLKIDLEKLKPKTTQKNGDEQFQLSIRNIRQSRNPYFTGRENELDRLWKVLRSGETNSNRVALHGLGGIGKTEIVLEYVYRYTKEYSIVWWIRADEPSLLASDYIGLADELKLPESFSKNKEVIINAVKLLLERKENWLIIFDDARSRKEISPYIPYSGKGHIIITSRNPNWKGLTKTISVEEFKRAESLEFLRKWTGETDEKIMAKLAEELGDLPLALEQAGAYIETTNITVDDYILLLGKHQRELLKKGTLSRDESWTVVQTWELSFQQVNRISQSGVFLMYLCSFFAPENIPRKIFSDGVKHLTEPLKSSVSDLLRFNDAIASLRNYSLVEITSDELSYNRLVQAVIRERLDKDEKDKWIETALNIINNAFKFEPEDITSWKLCSKLLPHALSVYDHCKQNNIMNEILGKLLSQIGLYLTGQGLCNDAKSILKQALSIFETIYGKMDNNLTPVLNYLGNTLRLLRELKEAKECHIKALEIDETTYGANHIEIGRDLINLGNIYMAQKDFKNAQDNYERALTIFEKEFGNNNYKIAVCLNNLGRALQKQGLLTKAEELYEKALKIDKELFGDNHPKIAVRLINLGSLYQEQGDLIKAKEYIQQAIEINEKTYGKNHMTVASGFHQLGLILKALGENSKSKESLSRSYEISLNFLGENHPFTKEIQKNLNLV